MNPEIPPTAPQIHTNDPVPNPEPPREWTAPRPRFSKKFALVIAVVVLLVIIGIGAYLYATTRTNLFDQALGNALRTDNFTQLTTAGSSHLTIMYDVSAPASSRVQTEGKIDLDGTVTAFDGYGTFKDSYMKFTTFTTAGKSVPAAALDKWFQVRKDGFDASGGYFSALFQNDPHTAFFGDLIFGNFSKNDRDKLLAYVHQHNVYKVDESKVQHQSYKGQKVAVYAMTENQQALEGFNKLVGGMIGLSSSQLTQDLSNLHYAGTVKLYVAESTKQFVHVSVESTPGGPTTVDYSNFGTTKFGGAPKPQTTFEQFEDLLLSEPSNTNTQST